MVQTREILTAFFHHDKEHGSYTAFLKQVPEAVAQGETLEEAEENLFKILPMVMEVRMQAETEKELIDGCNDDMIQKSYFETL